MSQRPHVLIELGAELDRAAREAERHRRIRVRGLRVPLVDGVVALLAVGCALAVAGFAVIALGHGRPSAPTPAPGGGASPLARRASGDLRAWFAALRRPSAAADRLPGHLAPALAQHPLVRGLDVRSSRRVISTPKLQVWLVLSPRELCEVEVQSGPRVPARDGFGTACIDVAGAERYGLVSAGKTFQAVLPDATRQVKITFNDGSSTLLTPNANGVILYTPKRLMREYAFTSPTGARINHDVIPPHSWHG